MKTQRIYTLNVQTIVVVTTVVGTTVRTEPTAFKNLLRLRGYCVQEPTAFKKIENISTLLRLIEFFDGGKIIHRIT
tara:strand:- start:1218 stop:1445 length:228 start_codon:yes stop_codon:yes gene_type:complete